MCYIVIYKHPTIPWSEAVRLSSSDVPAAGRISAEGAQGVYPPAGYRLDESAPPSSFSFPHSWMLSKRMNQPGPGSADISSLVVCRINSDHNNQFSSQSEVKESRYLWTNIHADLLGKSLGLMSFRLQNILASWSSAADLPSSHIRSRLIVIKILRPPTLS